MNTTVLLRVASVISLFFAAGHSLGGRKWWSPMGENEVLKAMRTVPFELFGVSRTYLDFFMGFGWSLSVFMLMEAVLLWQLAGVARTDAALVKPMIAVIGLATLATGVISWKFLFPVPAVFSAVLALVLLLAFFAGR